MEKVRLFAKRSNFQGETVLANLLADRIRCMVEASQLETREDQMKRIKVRITMIDCYDVAGQLMLR